MSIVNIYAILHDLITEYIKTSRTAADPTTHDLADLLRHSDTAARDTGSVMVYRPAADGPGMACRRYSDAPLIADGQVRLFGVFNGLASYALIDKCEVRVAIQAVQ